MLARIIRWVKPPAFEGDEERSRGAALLNIILWIFIGGATLYGVLAPLQPELRVRRAVIIVPFVLILLFLKQLVNWGRVRLAGGLIVFSLWLVFTGAMFFGADYKNPAFMGYLVVVVCAGLVLNWRAAISWSIFCVLTNAVVLELGIKGILPETDRATPPFAFWAAQTLYIIISTILLSQALRKIDQALGKAQYELTQRKLVESERETFINELESKNAELERFTYTVSHDLKSPLITIGGYLGFLEKDIHQGRMDKFDSDLERIREATEKMQTLLNDLLELSRIGRLMNPPEEVQFKSIVQEALALVDGSLRQENVHVVVQDDLPSVYGDHSRLVEVVQNLVDNAAKFMGDQTDRRIEVGAQIENGEYIFFVKDNGIGIDSLHHDRIFGLFNKLDPDSEGSGVGLALVKRTVEVHEGRIWVESSPGTGTVFYFTLPKKNL